MMMSRFMSLVAALLLAVAGLMPAGCDPSVSPRGNLSGDAAEPLTVLVAASTREGVEEVVQRFRDSTGLTVRIAAGPSNALAQQIMAGAPADLYLSANEHWADAMVDAGLSADRQTVLKNRLVVVAPRGNPAGVRVLEDLVGDRVKYVALAGEQVPAGMYAGEALETAGLLETLEAERKIVRGHDVRIALAYVEEGEAEAAIVYATDALDSGKVETVATIAADTHQPIRYPLVLVDRRPVRPAARKLYEFMVSDEAAAIFRKYGFEPATAEN